MRINSMLRKKDQGLTIDGIFWLTFILSVARNRFSLKIYANEI